MRLQTLIELGAGLVAILGFLTPPGRLLLRALQGRIRPDHSSLTGGSYRHDAGGRPCPHVNMLCGPSWQFRFWSNRSGRRFDPGVVDEWVGETFPAFFGEAEYRDPNLIRYMRQITIGDRTSQAWLWIWRRGLIDVSLPISHLDHDGHLLLALEDVVRPVVQFVGSVERGWYERIFGRGILRRRRLDWSVSFSSSINDPLSGVQRQLEGFVFPGREPKSKPSAMMLYGTPSEANLRALRTKSSNAAPAAIAKAALDGLLRGTGYDDCLAAIEDALGFAGSSSPAQNPSRSDPPPPGRGSETRGGS
jgi:hypothetical protein